MKIYYPIFELFLFLISLGRYNSKNEVTLTQTGLPDQIVKALVLQEAIFDITHTPAKYGTLIQDQHCYPCLEVFDYVSVVGMLIYFTGHTQLDIVFSVHQCARYNYFPKAIHEKSLKIFGRCLKKTRLKGMIFRPSRKLNID